MLVCPRCPSAQVKRKGRRFRELQTVPIGLKRVWLVTEVPQCECRACVRSARPSAGRAGNGTASSARLSTPATARARVPAPGLAAMRDFHAWPGITGSAFCILHSAFFILPSSPRGRFAASQAVWGRYGGGMGAVRCWSGGTPMRVTELSDNEKLARQAIIATPLPTQQPVTLLGLSGTTLSWWKHYILTTPFRKRSWCSQ